MYPKEREFLYPESEVRGERERGVKVDKGWGNGDDAGDSRVMRSESRKEVMQ